MVCEMSYRVLLVSPSLKFRDTLLTTMPEMAGWPLTCAANVGAARRELVQGSWDFVIVNTPLADEFGSRFALDVVQKSGCLALVLVKSELFEDLNARLQPQGVFTLAKPLSSHTLRCAIGWLIAARERLRMTQKKAVTVEEKMEEIRLINRAKWLLIEREHLSEPDAHRRIEKQAMDRCLSRREIAREIIDRYLENF